MFDVSKNLISIAATKLVGYFSQHPEIILSYIFGSSVNNTTNMYSDIDIAVLIDTDIIDKNIYRYGYKAQQLTDLIRILETNNVDLVILNNSSYLLRHRVVSCGKCIYSKDVRERIAFETKTVDVYCDIKNSLKLTRPI